MRQIDELICQLSQPILSLQEFFVLSRDCLSRLLQDADMTSVTSAKYQHYVLPYVTDQSRYPRPINQTLFISDTKQLISHQSQLQNLLAELSEVRNNEASLSEQSRDFVSRGLISRTIYTTLQVMGCTLDRSPSVQGARKNFGQRFEDIVRAILGILGVANDSFTFRTRISIINVFYRVPLDVIMNPNGEVHSDSSYIDPRDTLLSIKTSSKDRMKFIFVDRFALQNILNIEDIAHVALYLNDVQRSGTNRINSTFVPDIYLVFCHVFGDLPLYYLDPPMVASTLKFRGRIKTFDAFIVHDVWGF